MIKQISPIELKKLREENKNLILIDVREKWEFDFTKIDGAINIPLGEIVKIANQYPHSSEIVLYCHHGVRSMRAANLIYSLGFKNIRNLFGGIDNYKNIETTIKDY